jgi:hypothetical protein
MNPTSDFSAPDERPVTDDELLSGDLTAALLQDRLTPDDQLPPALAARIVSAGEALVRAHVVPPVVPVMVPPADRRAPRGRGTDWLTWAGWLTAAALLVFFTRSTNDERTGSGAPATGRVTTVDPRAALRDSLLASPGVLRQTWSSTTDSAATGASGEVLWDPVSQRGVMRFVGMTANDRDRWQYQLWIFDAERDERYPVDGGVFDIPPDTGEVLVPIRARLGVGKAVLFAVTVEQPGGVVVSSRERIAVTARL